MWPFYLNSLKEFRGNLWEDLQQSLLDWTTFLCDLGVNVDIVRGSTGATLLMVILLQAPQINSPDFKQTMEERSNEVFLLCLLNADVSLRRSSGCQALHTLLLNKWSAEFSPYFIDQAYILIHFGGADIFAVIDGNLSPTILAFDYGWWDEWEIVLERCGLDPIAAVQKEFDRWGKIEHLGDGESTAVDTQDLMFQPSGDVTRRKAAVGDRLDE